MTNKIKNKYELKSENLNYNSQIFTLTSLFLHDSTQPHQASTPPSTIITVAAAVLFFISDPESRLLLLLLLLRSLITITHGKSNKFLSSLKFIFLFFCLCYIALPSALAICPLPSLPSAFFLWIVVTMCVDCICELWLLLDWCVHCACVSVWTVDLVCVCGFVLTIEY